MLPKHLVEQICVVRQKSRNAALPAAVHALMTVIIVAAADTVALAQPSAQVFQLTSGNVSDFSPAVSGTTYVWRRGSGNFGEIYMWTEGDPTPVVISSDTEEFLPRISGGRVVWESRAGSGSDYDVVLWENGSDTPLQNDSDDQRFPDVGGFGMVWKLNSWWLVYDDGVQQIQVTAGVGVDEYPRVVDDTLVWQASGEIFHWQSGTMQQLTNNGYVDGRPETDGTTVVWFAANGPSGSFEIMRWTQAGGTVQLTNNAVYDTQPDVSGDVVVFSRDDGSDYEIFFRHLGVDYQITNNSFNDFEPAIDGDRVVWQADIGGGIRHIYYAIISGLDDGKGEGACCAEGTCQIVTEMACTGLDGTFWGVDTVCVPDPCVPTISVQPSDLTLCENQQAEFTVVAGGIAPLTYQWQKDDKDISGAQSATLLIPSVLEIDQGNYSCVVSNDFGSVESNAAFLDVVSASECSDALFCSGEEICVADGVCGSGAPPCPDPQFPACNEDDNVCDPACQGNEDCDDADPCNGVETCDLISGLCGIDIPSTCLGDNDAFTTSEDKLWSVNLEVGGQALIGTAFGTQFLTALSFDPTSGWLYSIDKDELVVLDPQDGQVLWSGNHGLPLSSTPSGLAFDEQGNLFLVHDELTYTIDPTTGVPTVLGPNSLNDAGSLTFSPQGQLYAIGEHDDFNGVSTLVRLDPSTGDVAELIGPLTDPAEPGPFLGGMGMDFDSRGVLYMVNGLRDKLYTVSLEDAVVTEIGSLPVTFGSLAIFRDCNQNTIHDTYDVATGSSSDNDGNGIPDGCIFCDDGTCDAGEDQCTCAGDCGPPPAGETAGLDCADGVDNDCDLLTDCADSDCETDPACLPPTTPGGPGDLLLTDRGPNNRVQRLDGVTGQFIYQFPGVPSLTSTVGLALKNDGLLYVAGSSSRNVVRFDLVTGLLVDTFVEPESGGLQAPWGITFGPAAHLYVVDRFVGAVRRYNRTTGAYIDDFVSAGDGGLFDATDIVFGPDGNLYVASGDGHAVLRFDGVNGDYIDDFVPSQSGGLVQPYGLVFGPDDNLYVTSNSSQGAVYRYNGSSGAFIDVFVPESSGGLNGPIGLAFGPDGNLYVTSTVSNVILRYDGQTGAFIGGFAYGPSLVTPRYIKFQPPECTSDEACDDEDPDTIDVCYTYKCHHMPFSRLYVDTDAAGANDGMSWSDAFTDLQDALDAASAVGGPIEVWVAEGTYKPDRGTGDHMEAFILRDGLSLYGGFSGSEQQLQERDPAMHITLLSGDLGGDDDPSSGGGPGSDCCSLAGAGCADAACEATVCEIQPTCCTDNWNLGCGNLANQFCCALCTTDNVTYCENSLHVVVASDSGRDAPTVIDGFDITGGNARGPEFQAPQDRGGGMLMLVGSPLVQDCRFIANHGILGAGAHAEDSSRPTFMNCEFLGNVAIDGGGGLGLHSDSDAVATNCVFSGNSAELGGAVLMVNDCRPTLTNCTLSLNVATDSGGGIFNSGIHATLTNSILFGNEDSGGVDESAQLDGAMNWDINFCCIQGWTGALGGEGNTGDCASSFSDPDGLDNIAGTTDDELQLIAGSSNIDSGNNAGDTNANLDGIQPIPDSDLDGGARIINGVVDKGAFEFPVCFYADVDGSGEADLDDLLCLTEGLSGVLDCAGVVEDDLDIAPCGGNGDLNLHDLISMLDTLGGFPPCPDGCP